MPAVDTVLLPLCIGLSLLGLIATGVAWRRGRRARVVQGVGLALAPVALYLTGLLKLVFDGVVAVIGWATRIVFSPVMWIGLSLLGFCVVLIVVGGLLARRFKGSPKPAKDAAPARADRRTGPAPAGRPQLAGGREKRGAAAATPEDPELAEIEALLKSRGIE